MMKEPLAYSQLYLRDEELRLGFDLLLAARQTLDVAVEKILAEQGLSLLHRPILYYIGQKPGVPGWNLMVLLDVSKQTLSRHLTGMTKLDLLRTQNHPRDRRQVQYFLTEKGAELERKLFAAERNLIAMAYRQAGADAVIGFRTVLLGLSPRYAQDEAQDEGEDGEHNLHLRERSPPRKI